MLQFRVHHFLYLLIFCTLSFGIPSEHDRIISESLPPTSTDARSHAARNAGKFHHFFERALSITLWRTSGDRDFKFPTFYGKDRSAGVASIQNDARDFYRKVHDERRVMRQAYRNHKTMRPELSPRYQDLVAAMYIPGEDFGTWTVSTAEEESPISALILSSMSTSTPYLYRVIGSDVTNMPMPLHVEIVLLYRIEQQRPDILAKHGGRYPTGTKMVVFGKYRSWENTTPAPLPACQDFLPACQSSLEYPVDTFNMLQNI